MSIVKRLLDGVSIRIARTSSSRYINFLRKKGISVGSGTTIMSRTCNIDLTRPSLVSIGNSCYINENFTLLTHDWVTKVFLNSGREFINSSGAVKIGNNVSFGQNVMVLKGVSIGDNCFVGAGSIVTKDIPANSIAVGTPCKVVMSLEDYYQKRLLKNEAEAIEYARSIQNRFGRKPAPSDFWEEFVLFVDGDKVDQYPDIPIRRQLGPFYDRYVREHRAKYKDFEDFLHAADLN